MDSKSNPKLSESYRSIIDGHGATNEAVTLNLSINGTAFDLVYNARDDAFDGSPGQIAAGIVNFANHYRCGYALLLGKDCWVSANSGISFQAQIESNKEINQRYDLVVLPLDDSVYIAELRDGFVSSEKVQPVEQALEFLADYAGSKAILAGGKVSKALDAKKYSVNCKARIFYTGNDALPYSFQSLNWLLVKNKLFHLRLLIPLAIFLCVFAFLIIVAMKFKTMQPEKAEIKPQLPSVAEAVVQPKMPMLPSNLKNSAGQVLQAISPKLTGSGLDFLKTCRLKEITINSSHLIYRGNKMDNTDMRLIGCGYHRLWEVTQALSLQLAVDGYNWEAKSKNIVGTAQATPRTDFIKTMSRLKFLGEYIHWQFDIINAKDNGKHQEVRVAFSGNNLKKQALDAMTEVFMSLSAKFDNGRLNFNSDSLELVNASLEFTVFTASEVYP